MVLHQNSLDAGESQWTSIPTVYKNWSRIKLFTKGKERKGKEVDLYSAYCQYLDH